MNWDRLIQNSAFRKAPFDPGEKEKGFRDAVLAQTFLQIVEDSPTTPRICRIALVTADNLLSSLVSEQTATATNIRIVKSVDELKSLVNTLVSTVSEEVVAKIKEKATSYFFVPNQEDTFFYTAKVRQAIEEKFEKELNEIPEGADRRENGAWIISTPGFLKKERQRVTWISPVEVEIKAFKFEWQSAGYSGWVEPSRIRSFTIPSQFPITGRVLDPAIRNAAVAGISTISTIGYSAPAERILHSVGPEKVIAEGRTYFEVTWSHILSTNQKFRLPRIDDIRFVKTAWETK